MKGDHCNGESPVLHEKTIGNTFDQSVVAPPAPTGHTTRTDDNQKSLEEMYPQMLPKDFENKQFYSKLNKIYEKPVTLEKIKVPKH